MRDGLDGRRLYKYVMRNIWLCPNGISILGSMRRLLFSYVVHFLRCFALDGKKLAKYVLKLLFERSSGYYIIGGDWGIVSRTPSLNA